jgi:hypothetical protein
LFILKPKGYDVSDVKRAYKPEFLKFPKHPWNAGVFDVSRAKIILDGFLVIKHLKRRVRTEYIADCTEGVDLSVPKSGILAADTPHGFNVGNKVVTEIPRVCIAFLVGIVDHISAVYSDIVLD